MEYLIFGVGMAAGYGLSGYGAYTAAGFVMIAAAFLLYGLYYQRSGMLLEPAALFSVSWVGGMGVSALKLSRLQTDWEPMTWISFAAAWLGVSFGSRLVKAALNRRKDEQADCCQAEADRRLQAERILKSMMILTAVSVLSFLLEAWKLSYIPLFTVDTPHAYSYFHLSGVHYFTVSCVLVPPMFVLYTERLAELSGARDVTGGRTGVRTRVSAFLHAGYGRRLCLACGLLLTALLIPILCVSRFQLIFAVLLAALTKLLLMPGERLRKLLGPGLLLFCCMLPLYLGLTVARAHDVSYLNGIFEMKRADTPIFFTQPYMYIANNFDNFNCLVRDLPQGGHTMGLRMLFPLWALSGLKFLVPALVSFPLYVTKTELTTVTLFYDAYYDFGIWGVALFGLVIGAGTEYLWGVYRRKRCPALCLILAQLLFYLLFSFFTTWFSNPASWFYLCLSIAFGLYLQKK